MTGPKATAQDSRIRIFALSDIHIDHPGNRRWVAELSLVDYSEDVLILAGDVSDAIASIEWCFKMLAQRFRHVMFVAGNHDLWVRRDSACVDSFARLASLRGLAQAYGIHTDRWVIPDLAVVPLQAWYDDSFGAPSVLLREHWSDYRACRWPSGMDDAAICTRMLAMNDTTPLQVCRVVSFSHFVPRADVLIRSDRWAFLDPVMGTAGLDRQIRCIGSRLHVFGHSHRQVTLQRDGVTYVNRALGYPSEQGPNVAQLQRIDHLLEEFRRHDAGAEEPVT